MPDETNHDPVIADTRAYVLRLIEHTGGEEGTLTRALDILERALKDKTVAEGAMHVAKDALTLALDALNKEHDRLVAENPDA
jgi:MoxR-like ATPase